MTHFLMVMGIIKLLNPVPQLELSTRMSSSSMSSHLNNDNMPPAPIIISTMENAGRKRELQTYMMSLDGIDMEDDEQDMLFAKYSVDTVYLSYLAARNRVRQYTQLLALLKRKEDAWLQRVEKAKYAVPGYKPEPEGANISVVLPVKPEGVGRKSGMRISTLGSCCHGSKVTGSVLLVEFINYAPLRHAFERLNLETLIWSALVYECSNSRWPQVLQGMNNEEKTLARTKTDGTHMRVSQSTGIMVIEIRMHQNLKENWILLRAHSSNSGGASTAVALYLPPNLRIATPYRVTVTTAPGMKYYDIHCDTTIILTRKHVLCLSTLDAAVTRTLNPMRPNPGAQLEGPKVTTSTVTLINLNFVLVTSLSYRDSGYY
ncbi:uncharacterized protein F5147DRAFT_661089 [Suillus discolor]|uniref:Uncharacterized protein n=1 Tax=Suillus discolor TaxID=1912936 RepID=A0A9P7EQA3_9AGAM|nr:uncharacterized protein F5147DRAFT_661089 [Suillus discolor]KAG2080834.1 hypothetical protein F5147DRAFT_661089 [Suillus discolor]